MLRDKKRTFTNQLKINCWYYSGSCLMGSLWDRVKLMLITNW